MAVIIESKDLCENDGNGRAGMVRGRCGISMACHALRWLLGSQGHGRAPVAQAHSSAAYRRDLLHGRGRTLWARGPDWQDGLSRGDHHSADHSGALEHPDGADGQRTGGGASLRRRILRVGAAGNGAFLGIPGVVADANRQRLRDGALSDAFRCLSGTDSRRNSRRVTGRLRWNWG